MKRTDIEDRAFGYFQSGFHCAEAVSKTIADAFAGESSREIPMVASGFGGGIGGTKGETCGALTGGIVALGYLYGRMDPGEDKKTIYGLASAFRAKFIETFGSAWCREILDGFGEQENMMKCKKLSAGAAGILFDILTEHEAKKTGDR